MSPVHPTGYKYRNPTSILIISLFKFIQLANLSPLAH